MTEVNRRHFLMSSVALKASALPSQNNTVRVAVVGFNGRGKAHISAYLKIPNVEIAADPATYSCKGDAEATAMFSRTQYRSPFIVPKVAGAKTD